jgi:ubiquitin C
MFCGSLCDNCLAFDMSSGGSAADAAATAGFSKIRIYIETLTGTTITAIDAHSSDTANVLNARFRQIQGIPRAHRSRIFFSFRGQVLEDLGWVTPAQAPKTLADYNIENENTLQLVPPSDCKMTFHVTVFGIAQSITVEARAWETIGELKAMIACQECFPSDMKIIFASHQLEDERTLAEYKIRDGSTLHCVLPRAVHKDEGLRVDVRCSLPAGSRLESFELDVSDTVDSLKAKIQDRVGVPRDQQSLFFRSNLLQDGRTLTELRIPGQRFAYTLDMEQNWRPEPPMVRCHSLYDGKKYEQTASFELDVSDTVDSLKAKVQDRVGVPRDQQRLLYKGRLLQDGRTLAECGVNFDVNEKRRSNVVMIPKNEVPSSSQDSSASLAGEIKCRLAIGDSSREFSIFVELTDTIQVVKAKLENKYSHTITFMLFMGNLQDDRTLAECGIELNDTLLFIISMKGDIGVFVSISDSEQLPSGITLPAPCVPGAQWLMQPALPSPLPPPSVVAELVRSLPPRSLASTAARPPLSESLPAFSCVAQTACIALRSRVDRAHSQAFSQQTQDLADNQALPAGNDVAYGVAAGSCEDDFRLPLALQELRSVVGDDACARILSALETDAPDAIVLRRTTASGRWINFHTDTAARTVQVPANSLLLLLLLLLLLPALRRAFRAASE